MNDLVSKYDVLHLLYTIFEKYSMATDKTDILGGFGKDVFDTIKNMPTIKKEELQLEHTTRYYSDRQEQHIAKVTGGRVQSNSGGTKFGGGDVHTDKFLIEAKTPTKSQLSFSVKKEWITKMRKQAFEQGKEQAVLAFRFDPDKDIDLYVLSEWQFLEYLKYKEEESND